MRLAAEFGRVFQIEEDVVGTALTLGPAQWQPVVGTGYAYSVPVARIPLAAVDMWWALNPEEIASHRAEDIVGDRRVSTNSGLRHLEKTVTQLPLRKSNWRANCQQ